MNFLNNFFKLDERKTTVKNEFYAGLTTFLSMAYILAVNPLILSSGTEMSAGSIFTATAIAAIVATLVMALFANYPVALASGMGMNVIFAVTLCGTYGYSYQTALAVVFCSGLVFVLISLSGIREKVINAIPKDIKHAVGVGIGLFITAVGLKTSGVIDASYNLSSLDNSLVLLTIVGLVITVILYVKRVPAAILLGIVATTIIGIIWGLITGDAGLPSFPEVILAKPEAPYFGEFILGFKDIEWSFLGIYTFIFAVLSIGFVDFFDTTGTLVSVGASSGLLNEKGELVDSGKALLADSLGTVVGAVVGTSNTTSYVESLSGVEVGGRTGLTSVFTALFFFIALFFFPIFGVVTAQATAPALIFVGILMAMQLNEIEWDKFEIAIPAFLTIVVMPLTSSISNGIAVGFMFYPITMLCANRKKEVNVAMYVLAVVCLLYFVFDTISKAYIMK